MMARTPQQQFIWAVGQQESGGNYRAYNGGSGALGRWQIMPANLPGWARDCGMPIVSPSYFLSHPLYQDRMAQCKLGRDYRAYGPRGAAAVWYSGQPNWHATYGNPPVYQYVADVIAIMGGAPAGGGGGGGGGGGPVDHTIHPPKPSWAPAIRSTVAHTNLGGRRLRNTAQALRKLR
jgi:hypothetical protein